MELSIEADEAEDGVRVGVHGSVGDVAVPPVVGWKEGAAGEVLIEANVRAAELALDGTRRSEIPAPAATERGGRTEPGHQKKPARR